MHVLCMITEKEAILLSVMAQVLSLSTQENSEAAGSL